MRKRLVTLEKYENIATGDIYYGYPVKEASTKLIDGITYIEVTSSITKPKISFIKLDNLRRIGQTTFERD